MELQLVIKQNPPPATRFYACYKGIWGAFNHFDQVVDWLYDLELDEMEQCVDLTEDQLARDIDEEYVRLTNNLRAV